MAPPKNFKTMKLLELKDFLKENGLSTEGNKEALIQRAKSFASKKHELNTEHIPNSLDNLAQVLDSKRKLFDEAHVYKDISALDQNEIPQNFDLSIIEKFLTEWALFVEEEVVANLSQKPARKGRGLYNSLKIQIVEFSHDDILDLILFRATMDASMKKELR